MRLIDADALKEYFEKCLKTESGKDGTKERYAYMAWLRAVNAIDNAPTVDAERHGKWEQTEVEGGKIYVCSECREGIYKSTFEENVHYYCSNCGAKMDKE